MLNLYKFEHTVLFCLPFSANSKSARMKQLLLFVVFIGLFNASEARVNTGYQFNGEQSVFTQNLGQVVDQEGKPVPGVLAKASMPGLDLYLTETGATYVLLQYEEDLTVPAHPVYITDKKFKVKYSRVDIALTGAVLTAEQLQFTGEAGWQSNYYNAGNEKGQMAVGHFKNLTVENVYPGIDWVWKFNAGGKLEYDFVVHPGANPSVIKMQYNYADLKLTGNNLLIGTRIGSITEGPLQASSNKNKVSIAYNLEDKTKQVGFTAGSYDKSKDLVIDPPLALNWSTQFGGSFLNGLRGVATDSSGGVFLAGYTTSHNFVTLNPHGSAYIDSTYNGQSDVILLKLDTNQNLKWSTYLGGPGNDFANSICFSPGSDKIFVTGGAQTGFPVTTGTGNSNGQDAFVAEFNRHTLALQFSSFYGGNGTDEGLKIRADNFMGVYIAGYTNSTNNSFASVYGGGYFQSTVTGQEAFIMHLSAYGNFSQYYTQWSTKFGGSGDDYATGLAIDTLNNVVVSGFTTSNNIPVARSDSSYYQSSNGGGADGFILKFNSSNSLLNSTYYGGSGNDYFNDVTTGIKGNFIFTGRTNSTNFPLRAVGGFGFIQTHLADSTDDAFIVKCANNLTMKWSTYYGGTALDAGTGVTTDQAGHIYVCGFTFSHNFPVDSLDGAFYQGTNHGNSDGFAAEFSDLGVRNWSTYKGDSCFQYPYSAAYDRVFNKFYIAGEGLLACGQSLPDTGQVHNGVSSIGFCWGFAGQNSTTPNQLCAFFAQSATYIQQPCPGQCNGIAVAGPNSQAHGWLHYRWSSGDTTANGNGLCANAWLEVQDSVGCNAEAELYFSPVNVTLTAGDIVCYPSTITVTSIVTGGNGNHYSYLWSTSGGVVSDSTVILVTDTGAYSVTVTDNQSCSVSAQVVVGFNNVFPQGVPEVIQYPSCGGNGDGEITLNYQNSDSLFPYGNVVWTDESFNVIATGDTFYNASTLTTYYAIDSAFCFNGITSPVFYSFNLPNSTDLATLQSYAPSACTSNDGQSFINFSNPVTYDYNGNITGNNNWSSYLTVDDYFPAETYLWSDGELAQNAVNLGVGTFSVTITDNACQTVLSDSFILPLPQVVPVVDSAYCNGGQIDLSNTFGGSGGGYSYQWSTGDFGPVLNGLNSGTYTATITDWASCADTVTFFVPQGTALDINISTQPPLCFGSNGTVIVTGSAGTPQYQGTGSFDEPAGTYNFTISDYNGCTAAGSATVTDPPQAITVSASIITPALCNGGDATVFVTANGGTQPYTGTGTQFEPVGTNIILVTDANGCTANDTITISGGGSSPIVAHNSFAPILCHGGSTTLTVTATGGHWPYSGTGVFSKTAGTYYYTITDSAGCSIIDTVRITQPTQLSVNMNTTGITCSPGSVTAAVSGGSPLYTFQWSTSPGFGDSAVIYVGQSGTYSVTAQDENFCSATATAQVNYNNSSVAIDSIIVYQFPSCGSSDGIVYITAANPSKITWTLPGGIISHGDTIQNAQITGSNDQYLINDSSYCFNGQPVAVQYSFQLFSPADPSGLVTLSQDQAPSGCNTQDGSIQISYTNSTGGQVYVNNQFNSVLTLLVVNYSPITYQWSNGFTYTLNSNQQQSFSVGNNSFAGNYFVGDQQSLNPGDYSVNVFDGSCSYSTALINLQPLNPQLVPHYSATNPVCSGSSTGQITLTGESNNIPNAFGDTTNTFLWSNGATTASISNLSVGTYSVSITGSNACPVLDTFSITSPPALSLSDVITAPLCINGNPTVTLSATGGTAPYSGTGAIIETPGIHILTVTDNNGCIVNDTIDVPPLQGQNQIIVTDAFTPILCNGGNSTITINATGGTLPYTGTGSYNKPAGDYVFTVTDNSGCSTTDSLHIPQPGILSVNNAVNPVLCYGGNATINLSCHGGTPPYTGTGSFIRPAGDYGFIITDANGCVATDSVLITQPTPLVLTDTVTQLLCYGGNATVTVVATGGTAPYYGTGAIIKPAGSYTLIVSDQNGCFDSVSAVINQPTPIAIALQLLDTAARCRDTVQVAISVTGGNGPYTGTGTVTYTQNGNYTISVTDAHGCTVDSVLNIHIDTCTGTENIAADAGVMVYPNPAADKFYVRFTAPASEQTDLRLFTVDGKLVTVLSMAEGEMLTEVNCNELSSGVYILRTVALNKQYNFKVVVTR